MKVLVLFFIAEFCVHAYGATASPFGPAEPYIFAEKKTYFFCSNHGTGARYIKMSPDGKYAETLREHMGIFSGEIGTWTQSPDGVVTLVSPVSCADILCGPLEIAVRSHERVKFLPVLREKISTLLASEPKDEFLKDDLTNLSIREHHLEVEIDYRTHRETISKVELEDLVKSIDAFLADPGLRNSRMIPLSYKDKVFFVNLNDALNRDHKEVCKAIDEGLRKAVFIYNAFMISEEEYTRATASPYPFKYRTEMNAVTGARDTTASQASTQTTK